MSENKVVAKEGWGDALKDPEELKRKLQEWYENNPPRMTSYKVTEKGREFAANATRVVEHA